MLIYLLDLNALFSAITGARKPAQVESNAKV